MSEQEKDIAAEGDPKEGGVKDKYEPKYFPPFVEDIIEDIRRLLERCFPEDYSKDLPYELKSYLKMFEDEIMQSTEGNIFKLNLL